MLRMYQSFWQSNAAREEGGTQVGIEACFSTGIRPQFFDQSCAVCGRAMRIRHQLRGSEVRCAHCGASQQAENRLAR